MNFGINNIYGINKKINYNKSSKNTQKNTHNKIKSKILLKKYLNSKIKKHSKEKNIN